MAQKQLRLLLWKDYLIRKRRLVTLCGILWATAAMLSLYIVRINIDNHDYPTCQYPARALPSAGMVPFLQSFICSVSNECSTMDKYQEIPGYKNAKLTKMQHRLSPLFNNASLLSTAASVPSALRLLASVSRAADEPDLVRISKNGLRVEDLFKNPLRTKRHLSTSLNISDEVTASVMSAEISFQGIIKGELNRCSAKSLSQTFLLANTDHLNTLVEKTCAMTDKEVEALLWDMVLEIDFSRYVRMLGSIYYKLTSDDRLTQIADTLSAVLHLSNLESFFPKEIVTLFRGGQPDFSYFDMGIISKFLNLFNPIFGETQSFKSLKYAADNAAVGMKYFNELFFSDNTNDTADGSATNQEVKSIGSKEGMVSLDFDFNRAINVFQKIVSPGKSFDAFNVISNSMNFILKWLDNNTKHEVLMYSTLLAKLIEGANSVIKINMNIQQVAYNASLRNPEGVKILVGLPPNIIGKGFEALADAERTQILTSKLKLPNQLFCDVKKLQSFLRVTKSESEALKKQLCTEAWKNYVLDLTKSFGFFDVKDNVNSMASILILETLGKKTDDQLYTIEKDFDILKTLVQTLSKMENEDIIEPDWPKILNVSDDSMFMRVVKEKGHLGKQMLITVHGALAKEIVKQNTILEYKISPLLKDATTLVISINGQLDKTPKTVVEDLKKMYPDILITILATALDEEKTYKSLSTTGSKMFCNSVSEASLYLNLNQVLDKEKFIAVLCNASLAIDRALRNSSNFGIAVNKVKHSKHTVLEEINWTKLINGLKTLYIKLDSNYTYLFNFMTYGMNKETQKNAVAMMKDAKEYWFGKNSIQKSMHLSLKLAFRLLDVIDNDIFDINDETWQKVKHGFERALGPLEILDDFLKIIIDSAKNESSSSKLPTNLNILLSSLILNSPSLIVDLSDIIANDSMPTKLSTDDWPCDSSVSKQLPLSSSSRQAFKNVESFLCDNENFAAKWRKYINERNYTSTNWNNTYENHIFLKFSYIFDILINDAIDIKDVISSAFNVTSEATDEITLISAWKYAVNTLNDTENHGNLRTFFSKLDTIISKSNASLVDENIPIHSVWSMYLSCSNNTTESSNCGDITRATWKNSFKFISVVIKNLAEDLYTYFSEVNEPGANLLQIMGFTKNTGLYMLYDKFPEYLSVLLNSYWDYGFMTQIRRASKAKFWDCDSVLYSAVPPVGSPINSELIKKVQPYVCPSLLHWISLPRGENTLLDVVAKSQYFFYTSNVKMFDSSFENAFVKASDLSDLLKQIATNNSAANTVNKANDAKHNLVKSLETILNYKLNETNASYRSFSDINKKQISANIYLARIVAIVSELSNAFDNLKISEMSNVTDEETKKLQKDLDTVQKLFKRRPTDAIALHFDIITEMIWNGTETQGLGKAFDAMCVRFNNNDTSMDILNSMGKSKQQICSKNYNEFYGQVNVLFENKVESIKTSLVNWVKILQNDGMSKVTNISVFLNNRKQLINYLKSSIKYSYDLSIPIYLQYLQSNIQHYSIVLDFLSGNNWYTGVRKLYNGPYAKEFFEVVENSFVIAEDVITNLDKVKFVRLIRDIDLNETESLCLPNITISSYFPDGTKLLSNLKRSMCEVDKTALYREIPSLVFAEQGYDSDLELSKTINYTSVYNDINYVEFQLNNLTELKTPERPDWITDDKLSHLLEVSIGLLSKESLTKVAFGFLSNIADAGSIFLNNNVSYRNGLSSWLKQVNLQLFKRQEYEALFCRMQDLSLKDVYQELKNDFHWDMAIKELISSRNYTNLELNKALNEFLDHVKLHILVDLTSSRNKLAECLLKNVTMNGMGNASLFVTVLSYTTKLFRSILPHIHEVEGISEVPLLKQIANDVSPNMNAWRPLKIYLKDNVSFNNNLKEFINDDHLMKPIEDLAINLKMIRQNSSLEEWTKLKDFKWNYVCANNNCSKLKSVIVENINMTLVDAQLPQLQIQEFWNLNFLSNILFHCEQLLDHLARLLGFAGTMNVERVLDGKIDAILDFMITILANDTMNSALYSLDGIMTELYPLLNGTMLEYDVTSLSKGLIVIKELRNYVINNVDLNVDVSKIFANPERIEMSLSALGINNTNFWSLAAPRVYGGKLFLKQVLAPKTLNYHISNYVCSLDEMAKVIKPSDLSVVTSEDVFAAIAEQFCGADDDLVKDMVPILLGNLNFTFLLDTVKDKLLSQLYIASNLTEAEGSEVFSKYQEMAELLPIVQQNVGDVKEMLFNDTLMASFKDFHSLEGLLSSSEFVASAGKMLCGKPFALDGNRFYKAIASSKDFSNEPDPEQLDVLPTDFCRGVYSDILKMNGGKIVWSFVKPLIMGKILYTPNNDAVRKIVTQANQTFAHMSRLISLVHDFSAAFPAVDELWTHKEGLEAVRKIALKANFGSIIEEFDGDIFEEFGTLKDLGSLLSKASEFLYCINMNRFVPLSDETHLTKEAARLTRINEFAAGLVFVNITEQDDEPLKVDYKIRMDIDSVPTTTRIRNQFWIPGPEANFLENMRYFRGFVQIQDLIDKAIIQLALNTNKNDNVKIRRAENFKSIQKRDLTEDRTMKDDNELKWAMYTQQMPYPCYRQDSYQSSLYESQALIVAFFFSMLFSVCSIVRFNVADKEGGNTMLMSVMGVNLNTYTLSWFMSSLLELFLTCICVTIVLCGGKIVPRTDVLLLFSLVFIFTFAVLMYCYMISKVFKSASLGAVFAALLYLVSFMPYVIILSLEAVLSRTAKLFTCLSMSTSFSYALLYIARFEAIGVGAHWADVFASPDNYDDMSIGAAAIMMLVDALIYFVIGFVIDKYFGTKSLSNNISYAQSTDEKSGVSVVNISKIYGEQSSSPKLALDGVSIEMSKGQITTLLGHNGAGKTTLIKILTGMLRPTSGHVTMRCDINRVAKVGICPQRDVLYESLTTQEHLTLYSKICGMNEEESAKEVKSMLETLGLGPKSSEIVSRLSGGTRRRVCIALAFITKATLVALDEPTSGVDPDARRDIWKLILALKQERAILMTTHHLDEAEILSDQVIIMHKGQIHTSGSPTEIIRTLGSGYKLTVTYPLGSQSNYSDIILEEREEKSIDEKSIQLLDAVKNIIKNAHLVDIEGTTVQIDLPFSNEHGIDNNYQELNSSLEKKQSNLGFESFTMNCCTLEDVFLSVCQEDDTMVYGNSKKSNHTESSHHSVLESPSKSASNSSIRNDMAPLVNKAGPLKGTHWDQFKAIMRIRYYHYIRNKWLLFLLIFLPSIFVTIAMAFSLIRPPADNEISLRLHPDLYHDATEFVVSHPSIHFDESNPRFGQTVMDLLMYENENYRNWTEKDSPDCKCNEIRQDCNITLENKMNKPKTMILPDVDILNKWLITSHDSYIEKRYGGFASSMENNMTNFIAWYNNKGHHSLPSFVNAMNNAILRSKLGNAANINTYTHPLKISTEQLSKSTVLQHVADAGISAILLVAYSVVVAGSAIYLVRCRVSGETRLQLLCGVEPWLYWTSALIGDLIIIVINIAITSTVLEVFGFPVFVSRNNMAAICLVLFLFGYACGTLTHLVQRLFVDPSVATMVLFCANLFIGTACIIILLILDIISESDRTDNARWMIWKVFMLFPQFVLGDALTEIAKNTIQALVLSRFGMDTYKDPLSSEQLIYHYLSLFFVGTILLAINLAVEYGLFDKYIDKFTIKLPPSVVESNESESEDAKEERKMVKEALSKNKVRLHTIGNINAGFVVTEVESPTSATLTRTSVTLAGACVDLYKVYPTTTGHVVAVNKLTLGIPNQMCTALLGANGAGKSTTFKMLTGEIRPTSGDILINEQKVGRKEICSGLVSYCPQRDAIDPLLTVEETLKFFCDLRGISTPVQVIPRTLSMFELIPYKEMRCSQLSGGNKRKLCTAIAIMSRSPLVLLDEPTSGVDAMGARACRAGYSKRGGVLAASHVMSDAHAARRRLALKAGRLLSANRGSSTEMKKTNSIERHLAIVDETAELRKD